MTKTVTIAATRTGGEPYAHHEVIVTLVAGSAGGVVGSNVIVEQSTVKLDADGEGSIVLQTNDVEITSPSTSFYRFTVADSSPTITRSIRLTDDLPSTVAWTLAEIQVGDPTIPQRDVSSNYVTIDGQSLTNYLNRSTVLFHQSWRRVDDGPVTDGGTNGEGILGAYPLFVTTSGTVTDGALRLQGDEGGAAVVIFADVGDPGSQFAGRTRFRAGFMFAGWADSGNVADLVDLSDNGTKITIIATDAGGNGPILQVNTKNLEGVAHAHFRIGLDEDYGPVFTDEIDWPGEPLVAGDTVEMGCIRGTSDTTGHTVTCYINGVEAGSKVLDFAWSGLVAVGTPLENVNITDPTKWRGGVTDFWMTTGDAWWPGSLPAAPVGSGAVDSVNGNTGVVVLTAADVGAAAASHTHAASAIASGTIDIARIPTGTTGSTVPFGNDARFSDTRTPTDASVTTAKLDATLTAALARIPQTVQLGSDQSVTSQQTLQNITGLSFAVTAGSTYYIDGLLYVTGATAADLRVGFTCPAGTVKVAVYGMTNIATTVDGNVTGSAVIQASGGEVSTIGTLTGTEQAVIVRGYFACTTNGTFQMQHAQRTSTGSATTVKAGSFITYHL